MRYKIGKCCMILGTVFIGLALALFVYNLWDANRAEQEADKILQKIENELKESQDELVWLDYDREMTEVTLDGYEYIGYLSIPSIGLKNPIMSQWSYTGLKLAPGRFWGSTFSDDLVLAGHNYKSHFGPIKWLEIETEVFFVDMDYRVWKYTVVDIETFDPVQVEEMITKTEVSEWDLTLFTCNTDGQTRCAVRCARID